MSPRRPIRGRTAGRVAAALLAMLALAASACSSAPPVASPGSGLEVVATTTVLADLVRQVGGDRVAVTSLVPRGGEVHTFDPGPGDVERLVRARLVFMNGLGLDDWLADLAGKAGTAARVVRLGEGLPGVSYLGADGAPLTTGATANPHLWLDVAYARGYVARIEEALAAADPPNAASYRSGAEAFAARLADLDGWVRTTLGAIPAADRRVVSFHDAFPYYAAAYGLTVIGTVVAAPGQDPSAGDVAQLVRAIRGSGVRAILAEAQFNPAVARTIAVETGVRIVTDLFTDSVGVAPRDTYEAILRWDTERIAEALR